jgi:subtilisin-like proprotein convertase family protein
MMVVRSLSGRVFVSGLLAFALLLGSASGEPQKYRFQESVLTVNDKGITVRKGANYVTTSTPVVINVDLRNLPVASSWQAGDPFVTIPKQRGKPGITNPRPVNPVSRPDPLLAGQIDAATRGATGFSSLLVDIEGQSSGSNPHDANGEVGPDYFVQIVNGPGGSNYVFHDKVDGSVVAGPFTLDSLPGAVGACTSGLGDPVVFYDEIAGRWVLTEFASGTNRLCVFVAQTADPIAGGYFGYEFTTPSFPDYPKYGVWHDAYYVGTNENSSAQYAMERSAMLAGNTAGLQRFATPDLAGFGFFMMPPLDHDGELPPPASEPGLFIRHNDDEVHNPGSNNPTTDLIEIFEFSVDFVTPSNSALTGPVQISISDFDSDQCGLNAFECFPQPGTSIGLDPLREVIMNMPKYRNFGSHQSIVANLATDIDGTDHAGVRWFELRKLSGGSWTLFQEGTFAPDIGSPAVADHRWMGGTAMDASGNIALAYSLSNDTDIFPSLAYTGRLSDDPAGVMTVPEVTIVAGSASHTTSTRWGDYASMSVDPADGCTFWFTSNYVNAGPSANTRIAAFRFDSCGEASFSLNGNNLDQKICTLSDSLADVTLQVTGNMGFANPVALTSVSPAGVTALFTPDSVNPDGSSTVSFAIDDLTLVPGDNDVTLRGTADNADFSGQIVRELLLSAEIFSDMPGTASLLTPTDGAIDQATQPSFSWAGGPQAQDYVVEIATDAGFTSIVYSAPVFGVSSHTPSINLLPSTGYFWRVRSTNVCGEGLVSPVQSFTTTDGPIQVCSAPGLAIPDSDPIGVTDEIVIAGSAGLLLDLDVSVQIAHTWVADLIVSLEHVETATTVVLINRKCPSVNDVDVLLDDAAAIMVGDDCQATSPAIRGTQRPNNPLSAFGGATNGSWRLSISDNAGLDLGTLDEWCLLHVTGETQTLDVAVNGAGSGSVSSTPSGIDCGATCSAEFIPGTSVDLNPNPDPVSAFSGWSGDCSDLGACTVIMDQPRSVTASFILIADDELFSDGFE